LERNHEHENACERYLLGEMSEQEQAQLEEAYFADDALFERFLAVKDDLIDAYARGDLAGQKRRQFEQHFLASEPRRERVEEARGFIRAVTAASTNTVTADKTNPAGAAAATSWLPSISRLFASRRLVWQGALAVLLLIALAGAWVLVKRFQSQRTERERLQNEEAARRLQEQERGRAVVPPVNNNGLPTNATATPSPERTPPSKPADEHPPQPAPAQVASIFLTPFSPRAATASNSLLLRPDTRAVRLRLAFTGDEYSRYDVILRTLNSKQVLSRRGLKTTSDSTGRSVAITLEPAIFDRQDYIITLSGLTAGGKVEVIGDYHFRVERSTAQSTPTPAR
jgi:type II secretory pathway pseudopilin PulG